MTAGSRLARAVPAPEFGAGAVLLFVTADFVTIRKYLGPNYIAEAQRRLELLDPLFIGLAFDIGLKGPAGFTPPYDRSIKLFSSSSMRRETSVWDAAAIIFEELPIAPADAATRISDALTSTITGKPYVDILLEREKAAEIQRELVGAE